MDPIDCWLEALTGSQDEESGWILTRNGRSDLETSHQRRSEI